MLNRLKHKTGILTAALCIAAFFACYSPEVWADEAEGSKRVIVSFGDSYSSGEGIPPFLGQKDEDGKERSVKEKASNYDWMAHRSTRAWSGMLTLKGVKGTMADHHDENWLFVAASGA